MRVPIEVLKQRVTRFMRQHGLPSADAETVADVLVEAEAEGITSHGLSRLPIYVTQLDAGGLNPTPRVRVHHQDGPMVRIDADRAMGPVAGIRAVEEVTAVAKERGIAVAAIKDAGHVGPLSAYVGRLARHGLVSLAAANTPPAMAPWGGDTPVLGTNPIALAAPMEPTPIIVDLSLSVVARGKILEAARSNETIPADWALDDAGDATTDPTAALAGSLVPAGGAKGYVLALLVEVLAGVLAGQVLSTDLPLPWVDPERPSTPGLFLLALDPVSFGSMDAYAVRIGRLAECVTAAGGRLPGRRRQIAWQQSVREGVFLSDDLLGTLEQVGLVMPANASSGD